MIARAGGIGFDKLSLISAEPTMSSDPPLLVRLAPPVTLYEDPVVGGVVVIGGGVVVGGGVAVGGGGGGGSGFDEGTNSTINVSMRVEHPKDVSAPSVPSQ